MTRPPAPVMFVLVLAAAFAACAEASGDIRRAENDDDVDDTSPQAFFNCNFADQLDAGDGTTWPDLYRDLFSASGAAGCGHIACHGSEQGQGYVASNVACFDEAGCHASFLDKLVRPRDREKPENSGLVITLRHCNDDRKRIGSMPKQPSSYLFSQKSIARVKVWIASGAPRN